VAHARAFRLEVRRRERVRGHEHGHSSDDLDAEGAKRFLFGGVVRQELDRTNAEQPEHRRGRVVAARVDGEPEHAVGVDRVGAVRLQSVGADFVGEADAPTFLSQVEHGSEPAPRDLRLRRLELVFAIALERPEDLAGDALGVNADGNVALALQATHDERDVLVGEAALGLA
jgi:hypothetical protein